MNFQRRARPQVNDDSDDYGTTDSSTESPKEVEKRLAGSGGGSHLEDERTSDSESESDKEDDDEVSDSEEVQFRELCFSYASRAKSDCYRATLKGP